MALRAAAVVSVLLIAATLLAPPVRAQDIDCTVQVNYEAVPSTNKDLLRDFGTDVRDYVNNYKWRSESVGQKVKCTLSIFVQGVIGDNRYSAQVFIGSQRPIFGSEKSTAVIRLFDDAWQFTYLRGQPINHNPYTFNDLTSFLDFYCYLILGADDDTYERLSGTVMYQRASDIASLGRSSGAVGWQFTAGTYNRTQFINELLNPKFEPLRSAIWRYHYAGLDSLAMNPENAYANLLRAVETIARTAKQVDPRNLLIRSFFDTKYMEIADLFSRYSDPSVFTLFENVDPSHTKTYEEYKIKSAKGEG